MGQDPPAPRTPRSGSRLPALPRRSRLPELLIVLAVAALIPFWIFTPGNEPVASDVHRGSTPPPQSPDRLAERSSDQPAEQEVSFTADPAQPDSGTKPPTRVNARPRANSAPPEHRDADPALRENTVAYAKVYEPHTLSLRRSDFNHDGSLDELDEELFSSHFENADPAADLNGDGQIDAADVIAFAQAREAQDSGSQVSK